MLIDNHNKGYELGGEYKKDFLKFLWSKQGGLIIWLMMRLPSRLSFRITALIATLHGCFTFNEYFKLIAPHARRSQALLDRYDSWRYQQCADVVRAYYGTLDKVPMYGKDVYFPNIAEFISLIYEIIIRDQYHARQFSKEDSVVIDAGANLGIFSIFVANLSPSSKVYCFEPVVKTAEFLTRNIKEYQGVICVPSGLGDSNSSKKIFVKEGDTSSSVIEDSPFFKNSFHKAGGMEEIFIMTLDAFVLENKLSRIDFIKIDVEGYEANVLRGAQETIKKYGPTIAMSAYHNPNDKKELPRFLKKIRPDYICELHREAEEDLICYTKK